MTKAEPQQDTQTLARGLALLGAIVEAGGTKSLKEIAAALALPLSTTYRLVARLEADKMVMRVARGRYQAGLALASMARHADLFAAIATLARPVLRDLAEQTGRTAHLGMLEDDMVTYLVRAAPKAGGVFTKEAMQLEAYCSAVGKVLLSRLPEAAFNAYLADGPFVQLTANTITDPQDLRRHIDAVRKSGFATDDNEVEEGLFCIGVPVESGAINVSLALSVSGPNMTKDATKLTLDKLQAMSRTISDKLV